jgi:hypothetical protein
LKTASEFFVENLISFAHFLSLIGLFIFQKWELNANIFLISVVSKMKASCRKLLLCQARCRIANSLLEGGQSVSSRFQRYQCKKGKFVALVVIKNAKEKIRSYFPEVITVRTSSQVHVSANGMNRQMKFLISRDFRLPQRRK